jgi:predicted TIM-barrel fold metal-dependent hydrolase
VGRDLLTGTFWAILRAMRWIAGVLVMACGSRAVTPASAPIERYRGPIIDMHAHLVPPGEMASFATDMPADADLRTLDRQAGIARSALVVIASKGDLDATRKLNDGAIAAANASDGQFFAIASVHPADGKGALDELARVAAAGVRVIKLHANTQRFDLGAPEVAAVVAKAAELGLVLLFDGFSPFDADQPGKFLRLAVEHPKARIIIAHIGGPKFDEMAMFGMARAFTWYARNVWFDLSATSHTFADSPYEAQLVWVARLIGTERILFGSDYPVDVPAHAVDDYLRLGFTVVEQRQIFHDNAAALLTAPRISATTGG